MSKRELPKSLPMGQRTVQVRAQRASDAEPAKYPLTIATDQPVRRDGWFGWYYEVLGHNAGEVDTDRLQNGIALLVNHDPDQRAGRIENGKVGAGKTSGEARFATTDFARSVQQEVDDGTLTDMSVGYLVNEYNRVADVNPDDDEDEDYLGTYRAVRWEPVEGSLVAIPADPGSGVGRNLDPEKVPQYPVRFIGAPATPPAITGTQEQRNMATAVVIPNPAPAVEVGPDQMKAERARVALIMNYAREYPDLLTRDEAEKALNDGASAQAVGASLLEKKRAKEVTLHSGSVVPMSDKERKQYSVTRGIQSLISSVATGKAESCFEREVSQTIAQKMGRDTSGFWMPTSEPLFRLTPQEMQKRALYTGTSGAGGATVATELISFLDVLRPAVRLFQMGAEFMGGMTSNFSLPKMLTDTDFNWVGENPGTDNTDIDPTFSQVQFTPKTATGSTSWSRQLFVQSSVDVEAKVRNSLVRRAAIAIDKAGIQGSGSSNQPKGVLSATGVTVLSLGTNGAAPTYQNLIDMVTDIESYNADSLGDPDYLFTPEIAGYLAGQPELSNSIALPIFQRSSKPGAQGTVNGHDAYKSNLVPKTLTKGTSAGDCHAIIAGVFEALTIAEWGAFEILLDPYTGAKQALIKIIGNLMIDVQPTYAQAFTVVLDALNSTSAL